MDGGRRPRRGGGLDAEWAYSARLPDALAAPQGWGAAVPGIPVRACRGGDGQDGRDRDAAAHPGKAPEGDDGRRDADAREKDPEDKGSKGREDKDKGGGDKGKVGDAGDKDGDAKEGGKPDEKPPMSRGKKLLYWFIGLMVLATLVTAGVLYWLHSRHFETTDDAYVDGNIPQVSAQVSGRVIRIAFADNQEVRAGQVLLELDPARLPGAPRPGPQPADPGGGKRLPSPGATGTPAGQPGSGPGQRPRDGGGPRPGPGGSCALPRH